MLINKTCSDPILKTIPPLQLFQQEYLQVMILFKAYSFLHRPEELCSKIIGQDTARSGL